MAGTFAAIFPILVVLLIGMFLRHRGGFDEAFWRGLDRLGFYVLYPVLLFTTILRADFSALSLDTVTLVFGGSLAVLAVGILASWPLFRRAGISRATFTSVFQASVRWNGFIALAVAEKMFPPAGAAMVALIMAFAIIPINIASVSVLVSFNAGATASVWSVIRGIATNPLIIGAGSALVLRALPFDMPDMVGDAMHLIGRSALGVGLMAIGAGLRIGDALRPNGMIMLPVALKLFILPAIVVIASLALGLETEQTVYIALCAAVPTAMNGYLLARQMGGDAESYAAAVTIQTVLSFVSIPAVLSLTRLIVG